MSRNEMPLREARAQIGHLVDRAEHHGEATIITRHGRPAAMLVPYTEEPPVTAQADPIAARIDSYITTGTAALTGHTWATAAWGTRGPQGPAELRDITERLYGDVRTRVILIAEATGRDNHDPDVLAEVDMDAAWVAACAGHLADWADGQIAAHAEEDAHRAAAYEQGDVDRPGRDHSERIAELAAMRDAAAATGAEIEESVRRTYIHNDDR